MKKLILVSKWVSSLIVCICLSTHAFAATERTDLIKVAYEGLSYFLVSASSNKAFFSALTAEQKAVAIELSQILEESSAIKFYQANKIEGFKMPDGRQMYAYVDQYEKVKSFQTANARAPELLLSSQRDAFKNLKPGEPERFLKTTPDFSGAIYVNVLKLNEDPNMPFDLGRAIGILVHEYGHKARQNLEKRLNKKFADAEIQPVIDKLGEDLGAYVRGKTNKFPLKNGVVIYAVESLDFNVDTWLDHGFIGTEGKVSMMANQGLYMWSEFQGEIRDISKLVRAQALRNDLPTSTLKDPYYHFVNMNMLLPTNFKVVETTPGQVSISMTTGQASMQLPFMKPNVSPDPKVASFNKRYRWSMAGHAIIPATTSFEAGFNGPNVILKSSRVSPRQISPLPAISAKIGTVQIEKNDLVFKVDIKDTDGAITFIGLTRGFITRACEIKIKNQSGQVFYLTSEAIDGSRANTERISGMVFRLKDAAAIADQNFEIESVYLRSEPNLMSQHSEVRLEVPLFEKLQVDIPKFPVKPVEVPKTLEIVSVHVDNKLIKIRLNTQQGIQKVSLVLSVQDIMYSLITATGKGESMYYKSTDNMTMDRVVEVTVNQSQFKTVKKDGYSEIQFRLFDVFGDSQFALTDINTNKAGLDQKMGLAQVLNPLAKIQEISVVSTSLQAAMDTTERSFSLFQEHSTKNKNSLDYILREFSTQPVQHRVLFGGQCSALF